MEFTALAEKLRPYTAQTIKLEVAPWIRDYTVDMEDLYTDLTLEKVTHTPKGTTKKKLENYEEMFSQKSQKQQKILLVSDPHYGKTAIAKKINYDWAKGIFTTFTVVFLVLLKLVRSGDTLENAIIEQTPALEAMGTSPKRLKRILETFSDKCLIILEGLDEHALGSNEDVLKIIQGRKLLNCGVIVTSRPHSTKEIQGYFPMVVNIQGFTSSSAEQFAKTFLDDQEKVLAVLQFSSYPSKEYPRWYQCPILLSFLCILIREEDINLNKNTVTLGEIYTRLFRCLYKKFTLRKGIEFHTVEFIHTLQRMGKIAFKTLTSGSTPERRDLIEELGGDVFDYGIVVGHEDTELTVDGKISITFLEKGMKDFLGAFYFINMLDNGESLEELLGHNQENPVITSNPLFLQFCLWLLKKSEGYFSFRDADYVGQQLQNFFTEQLMKQEKVWDLPSLCHVLNFSYDVVSQNELTWTFFEGIITLLHKTFKSHEQAATDFSAETMHEEQKAGTSGM